MKILVSAGHTNNPHDDRGAAGNGFIEGVETVKIRDSVASLLRDRGLTVIEDGSDGVNDPLTKAIALARTADIAVEFHFNAGPPAATGVEVLSKTNNRKLAQRIAKEISSVLGIPARGGDGGWKSDSSGQHHRLGFCEAGGLIVEVCFISNKSDMDSYVANFGAMCIGVANAIDGGSSENNEAEFYTVQNGDTLTKISTIFHTNVQSLIDLNALPNTVIRAGQRLKVR